MADRFQQATATRPFKCEDCKNPVNEGDEFFWDSQRKVGPKQISARVCPDCKETNSDDGITALAKGSIFSRVSQSPTGNDLAALKGRVGTLEKQIAEIVKWIKEQQS
jgi:hypothetical protein